MKIETNLDISINWYIINFEPGVQFAEKGLTLSLMI